MLVWFGRFIQRVNAHDGKLDDLSKDMSDVKKMFSLVTVHDGILDGLSKDMSDVKKMFSLVTVHDSKLDELSKDVDILKQDVTSIKALLMMKYKGAEIVLSGKHSPRTLTEQGLKVFHDMKGDEFLKKNKVALFAVIDRDKPKTAYDVENLCYFACVSFVNDDMFNEIKSFLYNYPTIPWLDGKEHEVDMDDACSVLSLPLRDMYLEEHPDVMK